jgi:hypothetical protein
VQALGVEVALTPTEFRMLSAFAEHPGRVLGHGQLLEMVWGDPSSDGRVGRGPIWPLGDFLDHGAEAVAIFVTPHR